jgi:hypothetical protein
MRAAGWIMLVIGTIGLGHSAQAQVVAPPVPPADLNNYCLYHNRFYSPGSEICPIKGGPPQICQGPSTRYPDYKTVDANKPTPEYPRGVWARSPMGGTCGEVFR